MGTIEGPQSSCTLRPTLQGRDEVGRSHVGERGPDGVGTCLKLRVLLLITGSL